MIGVGVQVRVRIRSLVQCGPLGRFQVRDNPRDAMVILAGLGLGIGEKSVAASDWFSVCVRIRAGCRFR